MWPIDKMGTNLLQHFLLCTVCIVGVGRHLLMSVLAGVHPDETDMYPPPHSTCMACILKKALGAVTGALGMLT